MTTYFYSAESLSFTDGKLVITGKSSGLISANDGVEAYSRASSIVKKESKTNNVVIMQLNIV